MTAAYDYIRDGAEIYRNSFAIIRREADLARFSREEERVAVRMIHASGMVEIASELHFSAGAAQAGIEALAKGAPILCDANMVAHGVTRARLPKDNEVICTLGRSACPGAGKEHGDDAHGGGDGILARKTRRRRGRLRQCADGLVSSARNARRRRAAPGLILAMPVGFVGAAESKEAAIADGRVPVIAMRGRKGGSAMAAAAINALASEKE